MKIIGNGFLSINGQAEAKQLVVGLQPQIDLVTKAVSLCQNGLESATINGQSTSVEKQKVIACVILARLLEISESMILLARNGFSVEVTASLRNFLEAYFIFGNVSKNPSFVPQYINSDLKAREKLINAVVKHKTVWFEPVNQYATAEVRTELKEQIKSVGAVESKCYEYAKAIGCVEIYDSIYRITSAATHSTPRSLELYVTEDNEGEVVAIHRHPQSGNIAESLLTLGELLLNVRKGFDELFKIDASNEIKALQEEFNAISTDDYGMA